MSIVVHDSSGVGNPSGGARTWSVVTIAGSVANVVGSSGTGIIRTFVEMPQTLEISFVALEASSIVI